MSKYTQGNETIFMSKYKHKAMKQQLCLNINKRHETTFMSKYKHKAMKQYLCPNINTRQ